MRQTCWLFFVFSCSILDEVQGKAKLQKLTLLVLGCARVTKAGVAELKKVLSKCENFPLLKSLEQLQQPVAAESWWVVL